MSPSIDASQPNLKPKILVQPWVWLFAALLVAGLGIFLSGLIHEGIWLDEAYTAAIVRHPPLDIARFASYDVHPPLYYLMLYGFVSVFGHSLLTLRLFSALGTLALMALGAGPIRRATNADVGLVFSFLVLITPGFLILTQEIRMYTWLAVFITASVVYGYLAVRDDARRDWTLFGVAAIAAAYTHYYGLMAVGILYASLFIWLFVRRQPRRHYVITAGLVALAYLPWLWPMARQMRRGITDFWVVEISGSSIINTVLAPFSYKFNHVARPTLAYVAWTVTILLTILGLALACRHRRSRGVLVLAVVTYLLTLGLAVAFSYAVRPILIDRYLMPSFGLLLLPAAYALAALPRRVYTVAACGLLLSLSFPLLLVVQREQFNGPQPQLVEYLKERAGPDDAFVHFALYTASPLAYYFPQNTHFLYNPNETVTVGMPFYGPSVLRGSAVNDLWQTHRAVWLIGCSTQDCHWANDWVTAGYVRPRETWESHPPFAWLGIKLMRVELAAPIPR